MPIKRYIANADNTITNAFKDDLSTRGTGSNAGSADILEAFSIYAHQSSTSSELSRVLIEFPISVILSLVSIKIFLGESFLPVIFAGQTDVHLPHSVQLYELRICTQFKSSASWAPNFSVLVLFVFENGSIFGSNIIFTSLVTEDKFESFDGFESFE